MITNVLATPDDHRSDPPDVPTYEQAWQGCDLAVGERAGVFIRNQIEWLNLQSANVVSQKPGTRIP